MCGGQEVPAHACLNQESSPLVGLVDDADLITEMNRGLHRSEVQ